MQKKSGLLLVVFLLLAHFSFSQNTDSIKVVSHFGGAVTVTNNGISFVPTFSLGKPAVIFDLSMGRRLSFEPQFRLFRILHTHWVLPRLPISITSSKSTLN